MKATTKALFKALAGIGAALSVLFRRAAPEAPAEPSLTPDFDEELARLTGELAHEIKNPLSTVKVNLKLAKETLDDIDLTEPGRVLWDQCRHDLASASRKIDVIRKETDRLEQILESFLQYVRRLELQLATIDLNELVGDMVDFYSPQARSHALTVRQSLGDNPLPVRVDPGALKQVLLNLLINAQQAMDGGGELMVRTCRRGERAVIQISDTGRGIPPERLSTLFRPYQSSRPGGTGLGLATAKKIVDAFNGAIIVHSEVGKGTSFTIELPTAEQEAHAEARTPQSG